MVAELNRANYLLDSELEGERVMGTYRDSDVASWRAELSNSAFTAGDDPGDSVFISSQSRPARSQHELPKAGQTWIFRTFDSVEIGPGGARHLELKLPNVDAASAYTIRLTTEAETPIVAEALGFATYPTPCTATIPVEFAEDDGSLVGDLDLLVHGGCRSITVMISHGDPMSDDTIDVELRVGTREVFDSFDRTVAEGWGRSDHGPRWHDWTGGEVDGSVDDGQGSLSVVGINTARVGLAENLTEMEMIGRFTDCSANQALAVQFGTNERAFFWTSGLLIGSAQHQLSDFDPCERWHLRVTSNDNVYEVKVWQATSAVPDAPQVVVTAEYSNQSLAPIALTAIGSASMSPTAQLLIDVIEVYSQPWT